MINTYDFIIVGQGLAGTTLAHIFLQQGQKVLIIDNAAPITSSKVAAGVWNPVVFRRYTYSFQAPQLLAFNSEFYPRIEALVGEKFYFPIQYYKVFSSKDDYTHWKVKTHEEEMVPFLGPEAQNVLDDKIYNVPHSAAEILQCGYVDVKKYLSASLTYFSDFFMEEEFDYSQLSISPGKVNYKQYEAKAIVFCEGMKALQNPWWQHLPFAPAKGEVLTIQAELPITDVIINKGIFIVPIGNNTYRAGATYRWEDMENTPTEDARLELIEKLEKLITVPYKITDHKAAVRPATVDRRPMLGLHPQHTQIAIFNGLGSRGVMLAPYFAHQLAGNILQNTPIDEEVNVARFSNLKTDG